MLNHWWRQFSVHRCVKKKCLIISVHSLSSIFHYPGVVPLASGRCTPQHFLCLSWHIPSFLSVPDRRELVASYIPMSRPFNGPSLSICDLKIQERWKDFLPRGCIRKPPMKSTEKQHFFFLQRLKLMNWKPEWHRCTNKITWLLLISGKTDVETR